MLPKHVYCIYQIFLIHVFFLRNFAFFLVLFVQVWAIYYDVQVLNILEQYVLLLSQLTFLYFNVL